MSIRRFLRFCSPTAGLAMVMTSFALTFTASSHAAFLDCPASFVANGTAKVHDGAGVPVLTAANDCEYIDPPDPSTVANATNIQGFFGFSDWDIWNPALQQIDAAGALSGSWAIPGVDFATYDYMITFKDGQGTNLTSFKLNELYASGQWSTPFTDPPFDLPGMSRAHGVSHFTISRRDTGGTTDVPEPSTILLLGFGLLGLVFTTRRSSAR